MIVVRRRGFKLSLIAAKRTAPQGDLAYVKQLPVNVAHILLKSKYTLG
ncbi:MAG: hypothetical protein ACXVI0_04420 [Halobacteriota archaeon]